MAFVELLKLHQLHDGLRKAVRVAGRDYILVHIDGQTRLMANECPHAGAPLTQGSWGEQTVRCSRHGISFDLLSGQALDAGCPNRLRFVPLAYEGNQLGVYVDN